MLSENFNLTKCEVNADLTTSMDRLIRIIPNERYVFNTQRIIHMSFGLTLSKQHYIFFITLYSLE